jgi:hypothetical protein
VADAVPQQAISREKVTTDTRTARLARLARLAAVRAARETDSLIEPI